MKKLLESIGLFFLDVAGVIYYLPCKAGADHRLCATPIKAGTSVRLSYGTAEERLDLAKDYVDTYLGRKIVDRYGLNRRPAEHASEEFEIEIYIAPTPNHNGGGFEDA